MRAAEKAVELQPKSDRTHSALARANFYLGETATALAEAKRAVQINPKSGVRLTQQAAYLSLVGDWEQGLEAYGKAQQLMEAMPAFLFIPLFIHEYQNERYEEALETLHKFDVQKVWIIPACLAATYAKLGNMEKASSSLDSLIALRPEFGADPAGYLKRNLGTSEGVEAIVEGLCIAGLRDPDK